MQLHRLMGHGHSAIYLLSSSQQYRHREYPQQLLFLAKQLLKSVPPCSVITSCDKTPGFSRVYLSLQIPSLHKIKTLEIKGFGESYICDAQRYRPGMPWKFWIPLADTIKWAQQCRGSDWNKAQCDAVLVRRALWCSELLQCIKERPKIRTFKDKKWTCREITANYFYSNTHCGISMETKRSVRRCFMKYVFSLLAIIFLFSAVSLLTLSPISFPPVFSLTRCPWVGWVIEGRGKRKGEEVY